MPLSRTLGQCAEVTGMWETSLWFCRNPWPFALHMASALYPYIAFYEHFCRVFENKLSRNLLDKRAWGFLEPFLRRCN